MESWEDALAALGKRPVGSLQEVAPSRPPDLLVKAPIDSTPTCGALKP
jgi:hypothetical protein